MRGVHLTNIKGMLWVDDGLPPLVWISLVREQDKEGKEERGRGSWADSVLAVPYACMCSYLIIFMHV